jgi:hypothetical protein
MTDILRDLRELRPSTVAQGVPSIVEGRGQFFGLGVNDSDAYVS